MNENCIDPVEAALFVFVACVALMFFLLWSDKDED